MQLTAEVHSLKSGRSASFIHLCLISAFIVTAYYPALHTPFILDDLPNIVLNRAVQPGTVTGILDAVNSLESGSRPLVMMTFAANFLFGGLHVAGYHWVNLVIHIGNSVILYFCIVSIISVVSPRLNKSFGENEIRKLAFWSVLLWALNPVQHQAVTYIIQRMTSLATLFYLSGILVYLKYRVGRLSLIWFYCSIGIFFTAGMACKEIVITLPVCLLMMDFYLIKPDRPVNSKWIMLVLGVTAVISYIYLQGALPDFFQRFPNRYFSPYQRMLTEPRVLWHYVSLLMLPLPGRMHLELDFTASHSLLQPATTLLSLLATLAALVLSVLFRHRYPILAFAIMFYFLASSVEASFLNLGLAYLHRLYLPSLFIFAGLLSCLPDTLRKHMGPVLILVAASYAYGTQQRNEDWQNSAGLWQMDYKDNSNPRLSVVNRGNSLVESGRYDDAINLIKPRLNGLTGEVRTTSLYTLALAYYYKGDYQTALSGFESISADYREYDLVLFYQGLVLLNMKRDAGQQVSRLSKDYRDKPYSAILTAEQLRRAGSYESAVALLEKVKTEYTQLNVVELNLVRAYLANVYLDMKQYPRAYALYLEIVRVDPDAYFAWQQIYAMQVSAGDLENARVIKAMLKSRGVTVPDDTH